MVKLSTHTKQSPKAGRNRFRPGSKSKMMAAKPAPALNIHQPLPPLVGITPAA